LISFIFGIDEMGTPFNTTGFINSTLN
jgi:hypothetical protein